jgi:hypothetical protein
MVAILVGSPSVLATDDSQVAKQPERVADAVVVASEKTNSEVVPAQGGVTPVQDANQGVAMTAVLAATLNRSQEDMADVVLPNGSVMRDLLGGFQTAIVMRVAPDGSVTTECVTNLEAVTAARAPVAAPLASVTAED